MLVVCGLFRLSIDGDYGAWSRRSPRIRNQPILRTCLIAKNRRILALGTLFSLLQPVGGFREVSLTSVELPNWDQRNSLQFVRPTPFTASHARSCELSHQGGQLHHLITALMIPLLNLSSWI